MKKFLVVTGPSAVGKSTIINHLLHSGLFHLSISYTTRDPRPGECDGIHYFFVSREVFEQKIAAGFFLESTFFSGNYYGTPAHVEITDKTIIFDIDIRGFRFFKEHYPASFFCLVVADRHSMEERLRTRMTVHGGAISVEEVGSRMTSFDAFKMIEQTQFDRIIDNSGGLREGLAQADSLVEEIKARGHE